ncbi:hypothetical protein CPAR01_07501 [Colletotrichum paranaense]|uniref:Uncharacterized protein n=1 Tax=Colletotrichum paranaense TaxID=1914294 RepID=A0ABQ9SPS6_9PEZI|nr:uncharacterized protein CPAR01_07501 [Colletotrichum paranaense]KAK1541512.1 hypothetical protein CPAR01_07501 [Colletotrichum paranaense]
MAPCLPEVVSFHLQSFTQRFFRLFLPGGPPGSTTSFVPELFNLFSLSTAHTFTRHRRSSHQPHLGAHGLKVQRSSCILSHLAFLLLLNRHPSDLSSPAPEENKLPSQRFLTSPSRLFHLLSQRTHSPIHTLLGTHSAAQPHRRFPRACSLFLLRLLPSFHSHPAFLPLWVSALTLSFGPPNKPTNPAVLALPRACLGP